MVPLPEFINVGFDEALSTDIYLHSEVLLFSFSHPGHYKLLRLLFSYREDMYAQDSIDLLQNSGIQFKKHEEEGIDPLDFAELLMTSGIVLMDNIKWLSFHRSVKGIFMMGGIFHLLDFD